MASNNSINNRTINASLLVGNTAAAATASDLDFLKNRSGGVITTGDTLGTITFQGYDSAAYIVGSIIRSINSGTVAANRIASNLEMWTHPDSTSASTQRMVINSDGSTIINAPDASTLIGLTVKSNAGSGVSIIRANQTSNDAFAARIETAKDRAGAAITSGDSIGALRFSAYDGSSYLLTSQINVVSSGTIAANRIGSDLEFFTHPDSTASSTQRMVINSLGQVVINAADSSNVSLQVSGGGISNVDSTAATTAPILYMIKTRSGGVITTGDQLGTISFTGNDGSTNVIASKIVSVSSGTIAANRVASNLEFYTHPDSTSASTQRLVIAPTGAVTINAPDSGVGLTVSGGGATVTGDFTNITTFGRTVGVSGIPVVVDNTGLFGTIVSSIRYKENVQDMIDESSKIMSFRPVVFNYKSDESKAKKYGLIAEEVEKVMPDLVAYDADGQVETIKYLDLPVLLLNEIQKLNARIKLLEEKLGV